EACRPEPGDDRRRSRGGARHRRITALRLFGGAPSRRPATRPGTARSPTRPRSWSERGGQLGARRCRPTEVEDGLAPADHRLDLLGGCGPSEPVSLAPLAAQPAETGRLLWPLDALRDDGEVERVAEGRDGGGDGQLRPSVAEVVHERLGDLQDVDRHAAEVLERGVAG